MPSRRFCLYGIMRGKGKGCGMQWRKKWRFDALELILSALLGIALIAGAAYYNYRAVNDHVVEKEQAQLFTIAKTVAGSLEDYFEYQRESLSIVFGTRAFREDLAHVYSEEDPAPEFRSLEEYYLLQSAEIDGLILYDRRGNQIVGYGSPGARAPESSFQSVVRSGIDQLGEIRKDGDHLAIVYYLPYKNDGETVEAVLAIQYSLIALYEEFVAPVRAGEKGYASVKDQDGILIMHPKSEDLGTEVMKARRTEFPDYDWHELEELVERQKQGEPGVGSYHSIWYTDEELNRVKKISAYVPAKLSGQFWIVNVSMDYKEMTSAIEAAIIRNVILSAFTVLIFLAAMVYIYKIKKDRHQLKKELSYTERLSEQVKKYEALLNSASDMILILSPSEEKRVEEANARAATFFGRSVAGMHLDELLQSAALPENLSEPFEAVLVGANGRELTVEISLRAFQVKGEEKLVLIARDLTVRKRQEAALRRSQDRFRGIVNTLAKKVGSEGDLPRAEEKEAFALELEAINIEMERLFKAEMEEHKQVELLMLHQSRLAALGEMIGNIAHQWRQPLASLDMLLYNLEEEVPQEIGGGSFDKAHGLIRHMSQTIDDFRYFFAPKGDKAPFTIESTLDFSLRFLEDRLRLKGIRLDKNLQVQGHVRGHANQLAQVIFNVINNAIDALEKEREPRILVALEKVDLGYRVVVEDNGPGFDPAYLEKAFEPHVTTKREGTGLGLYMARTVIEKHFGGSVHLENHKGGARVIINIGGDDLS